MNKRTKLLLQENNEAEKQLSDSGQRILTDVVVYLRTAPISLYRQESVRRDITQMLLDGEARGDDAQSVIGNDYQTFCDSVISEIPPLSASARVLTALRDILPATVVLLVIWLIGRLSEYAVGIAAWPTLTVTVGDILGGVLLLTAASGGVTLICRTSFSPGARTSRLLFVMLFLCLLAALCAGFFLEQPLFTMHFLLALVLPLLLLFAYKLLDKKLD
ncbi:MAG TPA: hypothetical protein H9845_01935 [Candidatus Agathobaculum pullicola]|nr:hypothetical protein [Candidatus Agathobaculum pullicola]